MTKPMLPKILGRGYRFTMLNDDGAAIHLDPDEEYMITYYINCAISSINENRHNKYIESLAYAQTKDEEDFIDSLKYRDGI